MAQAPVPRKGSHEKITSFISKKVKTAGAYGVVLGISGGIDSALVAKLSVDALGPEKVTGLILPAGKVSSQDVDDARLVVDWLGIESKVLDLSPIVDRFVEALDPDIAQAGNIKARCRMIVLYHHAHDNGRLVAGTGNKSELLLGYFTKHGDGASDLLPIGDLYKTQVKSLSRELGVPDRIVDRPPSAALWKGQTDENELGLSYEKIDLILYGMEEDLEAEEIAARTGIQETEVVRIMDRVVENVHKRNMPPIPKIGRRTIGLDWED